MFVRRSSRLPMLTAYLAARPTAALPEAIDRAGRWLMAGIALMVGAALFGAIPWGVLVLIAACFVFVSLALSRRAAPTPTPEQQLARQADEVVKTLWPHAQGGRLHRALHPGVGATLEECAGYHARILHAAERWEASDLRKNALLAARVAMDEALVHVGATLAFVPAPGPLEGVLEDVGLVRPRQDPLPPSFQPVREIAERLRELAVRCETAAALPRFEEAPVSAAFRHLDAALGEMRSREEAERELRQGA